MRLPEPGIEAKLYEEVIEEARIWDVITSLSKAERVERV